jgi:hypothetical protein
MVLGMEGLIEVSLPALAGQSRMPAHTPSGAALLALQLAQEARGIRGLDVLRRSVDRAPPVAR